jgi:ABC-type bacteriocin/lantibiotic exporter with double-glycine peptidase domain
MLRYTGVAEDPTKLRDRFGNLVARIIATEFLRTAAKSGVKSGVVTSDRNRLAKSPLPGIATKESGHFVVAEVAEDKALIHDPIESGL